MRSYRNYYERVYKVMRLIDSDDLLTAFSGDEPMLTTSCVRMTIRRMPTIEAEPIRHGHWIFIETDYPVKDAFYML